MEIDRYSGEATVQECRSSNQESRNKWDPKGAATSAGDDAVEGSFDCNICLDSARDPVVTFCGHMYCWPCIYKWLNQKTVDGENQRACPVCKVGLTQTMLVPLYGRWAGPLKKDQQESDEPHSPIPHRPSPLTQDPVSANPIHPHQHHTHQDQGRYQWAPRYVEEYRLSDTWAISGTAVAVLPWVFGSRIQYSNPYYLVGPGNGGRRLRRAERSLSRISAFLVCCLIMCLLLF